MKVALWRFAQLAPRLRGFKALSITAEQLREMLGLEDLGDVVRVLRETRYARSLPEAASVESVDAAICKAAVRNLRWFRGVVPDGLRPMVDAYASRYVGLDLAYVASSVAGNATLDVGKLASPEYEPKVREVALRAQEERSLDSLVRASKGLEGYLDVRRMISFVSDVGARWAAYWAAEMEHTVSLSRLVRPGGCADREARSLLCVKLDYRIAAAMVQLSMERPAPPVLEAVSRHYGRLSGCRVSRRMVAEMLGLLEAPPSLLTYVQKVQGVGALFEGREVPGALARAASNYRKAVRSFVTKLYARSPFNAGVLAAALELSEVELADLRLIVLGRLSGLGREYLAGELSVRV